ncbi:Glycosyltransferase involved in cell wall bisynthesis [Roseivivax lentus]|uniref:Glycosyltransferase involved in cell wall bisynthesis n=2 Tax=Roseivivax lentus TaxID=633194 RepID=A0A1N7PEA6_9RHOB|nr:Glycosyltransferase involved in cell wall bisynthesis [Roseivivax lentus]
MRIAYVTTDPGIPVWGAKGASVHVQEMLRAVTAAGHSVTVLSPRLEGTPPADLAQVAMLALPPAPKGAPEARAKGLLAANADVCAALDTLSPDIVYERHALYAHGATEWARAQGVPSVLEVNAPLAAEAAAHRTLALAAEADSSAQRAMSAATLVSAVSEPVADHARQMGAQYVTVEPNAVDPARFPAPAPLAADPFTVGFLGSLKPWHGMPLLIDAFALLRASVPDARLLIVGDGPERADIERRLAAAGCADAAEITGLVPAAEVPAHLARMDAGCAPYGESEAFYFSPLKVYEYMAAGVPVVVTRVGHLPGIVSEGLTGLVGPAGDPQALADRLAQLAADAKLRRTLGADGRDAVLGTRTWAGVAARVLGRAMAAAPDRVVA